MEYQPARSEYKKVWSALSATEDQAKLHVIGVTEEAALQATGEETLRFLRDSVGIAKDDVVLEIGCGDWACRQGCGAALPKMDRLRRCLEHAFVDRERA